MDRPPALIGAWRMTGSALTVQLDVPSKLCLLKGGRSGGRNGQKIRPDTCLADDGKSPYGAAGRSFCRFDL